MEVDRKKFEEHIKQINFKPCPLCGKNTWSFVPKIFMLPEYQEDPDLMSFYNYPVIPMVCDTCGNTLFISAIVSKQAKSFYDKNATPKDNKK